MAEPLQADRRPSDAGSKPTVVARRRGWPTLVPRFGAVVATVVALALLAGIYVNTRPTVDALSTGSPADTVAQLTAGVQVTTYVDLLGYPLIKKSIRESRYVEWIWKRPQFAVQALVDDLGQVAMYTLTSIAPDFHPSIPLTAGPDGKLLRLGIATFSQIGEIVGSEGVYPANAKYHYSELFGGGGATHERLLIVTNSWDGAGVPAPPGSADELSQALSLCGIRPFGFSSCESAEPGARAALAKLRSGMRISGFTITAPEFDLTVVDVNRSPWILDSACDVPGACR